MVVAAGGTVACRVSEREGRLSFKYGEWRDGHVVQRHYWSGRENADLAVLTSFAADLNILTDRRGSLQEPLDAEWLVRQTAYYSMVVVAKEGA